MCVKFYLLISCNKINSNDSIENSYEILDERYTLISIARCDATRGVAKIDDIRDAWFFDLVSFLLLTTSAVRSLAYELSVSGYGCRKQVWDRARIPRRSPAGRPVASLREFDKESRY